VTSQHFPCIPEHCFYFLLMETGPVALLLLSTQQSPYSIKNVPLPTDA